MKKFALKCVCFIAIIAACSIIGGIFGALHDQITYSISPEYYTKLKFIQFGLLEWGMGANVGTEAPPEILLRQPRLGAAIIGFLSTWWMGLIIGVVLGLIGFMHANAGAMLRVTARTIQVVLLTTVLVEIVGSIVGLTIGSDLLLGHRQPDNLEAPVRFGIVAVVHTCGYVGGLLGLLLAGRFSILQVIAVR